MLDLQRIFGCLLMKEEVSNAADEAYVIRVAKESSNFSQKVTLPMTANSDWRT